MNSRQIARRAAHSSSRGQWFDSPWRIAGRAITSALAILAVGAVLALVVIPRLLGGDSLTVLSGSMEPTFSPGDIVVVKGTDEKSVCSDAAVGSIVTFFPKPNDPSLITHRVVGKTIGTFKDGTDCRLITQGDNNSSVDEPVSPSQIRGIFIYGVPNLGWARQWAGENTAVLLFMGAVGIIAWGLWSAFRPARTTVMSVPRSTAASGVAGLTPDSWTPDSERNSNDFELGPSTGGSDHDLRERELSMRVKELDLRERELEFALQQSTHSRANAGLDLAYESTDLAQPTIFQSTDTHERSAILTTHRFEA